MKDRLCKAYCNFEKAVAIFWDWLFCNLFNVFVGALGVVVVFCGLIGLGTAAYDLGLYTTVTGNELADYLLVGHICSIVLLTPGFLLGLLVIMLRRRIRAYGAEKGYL